MRTEQVQQRFEIVSCLEHHCYFSPPEAPKVMEWPGSPSPRAGMGRPATTRDRVLAAVTDSWQTGAQIVQATGIDRSITLSTLKRCADGGGWNGGRCRDRVARSCIGECV